MKLNKMLALTCLTTSVHACGWVCGSNVIESVIPYNDKPLTNLSEMMGEPVDISDITTIKHISNMSPTTVQHTSSMSPILVNRITRLSPINYQEFLQSEYAQENHDITGNYLRLRKSNVITYYDIIGQDMVAFDDAVELVNQPANFNQIAKYK